MRRAEETPSLTSTLHRVPAFADLELAELRYLAKSASRRDLAANEIAFLEGAPLPGLYVVEAGWLKGSKIAASGREQVLRYFGPGEAINEVSLFLEIDHPATLTALEPAVLWLIPRQIILRLVDEQPMLLWRLTQGLAKRLLYVVSLVEDLSLLPLETRVARYLLNHAEGDRLQRQRWGTQAELAARLGTVPDVMQRVLRALSDAELIRVERQYIIILDRAGLARKADIS